MPKKQQQALEVRRNADVRHTIVRFYDADKKPSWKMTGHGTAELEITMHDTAEWMEFRARETAFGDGREHTKEVYITLDAPHARELYEALRQRFEPAP